MRYLAVGLILSAGICLMSCTAPGRTVETLEKSGYTEITTHGYAAFSCGQDDSFATAFHARNPAGQYVNGAVCCGTFKSCTVRF